jgi:hypothetical protein
VTEGVVSVRHDGREMRVTAGGSWPTCEAPAPIASAHVEAPLARSPVAAPAVSAKPTASSTLADQNDLFERAVAFERQGAKGSAVATFDRLLAEYPRSPLVESATVERMKVLASSDPARARREAELYLTRWPQGFGRKEAEAILARGP